MLRNFFVVSVRNLLRHRTFSVMNLAGLVLGIGSALFIFLLVRFEESYDQYHANTERIYRINGGSPTSNEDQFDTGTPHGIVPILRAEFPEVEMAAAVFKINPEQSQVEFNGERTRVNQLYFAMPEFFKMTDYKWIQGSPEASLGAANQVVLTETMARKFFNGDAMGKSLRFNNQTDLIVSGIISDPPMNTDFPFEVVMSHATLEQSKDYMVDELQGSNSFYHTYILLRKGVDPKDINAALKKMVAKHLGKEIADKNIAFRVMPLKDIHFRVGNFNQRTISKTTLSTLNLIGAFILGIACINFTNLSSAQAIRRSREVGIRKTLGSSRKYLIAQFLGETFLVALTATILSFGLVAQLIMISYNLTEIPLSTSILSEPGTYIFLLSTLVIVTVLSGAYPAFILSGYKPSDALRSAVPTAGKGLVLRKGLIAFQFVISQVLIVSTLVVIRQVDYFTNLPLGFNKEAVLTTDIPDPSPSKLSSLKNSLLQHPEIKNITYSLNTPSATINKWWAGLRHASFGDENHGAEVKFIDSVYFNMFEILPLAGSIRMPFDSGKSVVVNEDLVKTIGLSDPGKAIGEKISYWGNDATIIGVVRDFQTVTLAEGMHPVIMINNPGMFQKISVKVDMARAASAIDHLKASWSETFPEYYFTYSFLKDDLNTFYREERKISRLLISFAIVAVGIGCIGLFGLIMFTSAQRTKEIGIRKILGATITNIVSLLSKDFVILVFIAGVIAWPIGYYAMDSWLSGFTNRINLVGNVWVFFVSTLVAVAFAMFTVGFQAARAAARNPTESLRME